MRSSTHTKGECKKKEEAGQWCVLTKFRVYYYEAIKSVHRSRGHGTHNNNPTTTEKKKEES
jgi:hypothetical protein